MPDLLTATPLIALRAVAFDTETTGLDVRKARVIEIGAAPIEAGRLVDGAQWSQLISCPDPIPVTASAVHGIRDADLAGCPDFAAVHERLAASFDGRVLIGHTVGFDVALLRRECERAGRAVIAPPALDVRVLAQVVGRQLPSYSLEGLAAWLGVESGARHRALGDAETAGRIFLALIPLLREAGIRTFGEAQSRCRTVADAIQSAQPAEWELRPTGEAVDTILPRLDSYPYSHRVRDVMNPQPLFTPPGTPLREALAVLAERKLSSVLVGDDQAPDAVGILTERDILRLIAQQGAAALEAPVGPAATRPLLSVPQDALIYRAIGRMTSRNIRHLAATDDAGRIAGIVTTRDLLKLRATSAIALGDDVDSAADVPALARAWAKLPAVAASLAREGVEARMISVVIGREVGALTRRAAAIAEAELAAGAAGGAPCPYAVVVLGSAGRGESLLAMDQDNAVIFADGEPDGPEDRWFAAHGRRMCAILHEVGVPLCKGGVMASEPAYRGSAATWRGRIDRWLTRAAPGDLLAVDIFFDFRAVHGDRALAHELWRSAWDAAQPQTAFLKQLAGEIGEGASHTTLLGRIRTEDDGRIDLKGALLRGIVTTARVLALRRGVLAHATADRLAGLIAGGHSSLSDLKGLDADHRLALDLILTQQLADIAEGRPPSNRVAARSISAEQAAQLKAALGRQSSIQPLLRAELSG
jgi:CBS domain-containing protein